MADKSEMFSQVLEDLQVDASDMMTEPKKFIQRVMLKANELAKQLDAKSTLSDVERAFKEKALKNEDAFNKAEEIFNEFYNKVSELEPEVLVNLLTMIPDLLSMANSSVRSMSMRTSGTAQLSKKQVNLLYIRLKNLYEAYITFMKFFHPDEIGTPPVIVAKKGNFSDFSSTSGIKVFEFIIDGNSYLNPFSVADKLGIKVKHYMDLPDAITDLQKDNPETLINGFKVELKDISKSTENEEEK